MLWTAVCEWMADGAFRLAAALSFYTVVSLAPLVTLVLVSASLFYGEQALRGEIVRQIASLVGEPGAVVVQDILANARRSQAGWAGAISLGMLVVGSSAIVFQLQQALNTVWNIAPKPGLSWKQTVAGRGLSILVVFGLSLVLLLSIVARGIVGVMAEWSPGAGVAMSYATVPIGISVAAGVFALVFKYLPDAKIGWREAWVGASVTALLFEIGRFALGVYMTRAAPGSPYGASGSLIALLLWINYSALILLFGAEFAKVYARTRGRPIEPSSRAVRVPPLPATSRGAGDVAGRVKGG